MVLLCAYQAGSGGVGPTILETSLLLAGEEVTAFVDNKKVSFRAPLPIENCAVCVERLEWPE